MGQHQRCIYPTRTKQKTPKKQKITPEIQLPCYLSSFPCKPPILNYFNIFDPHYHEINTVMQCNQQTMIMQESKSDFQQQKNSIFTTMCVQQHTESDISV